MVPSINTTSPYNNFLIGLEQQAEEESAGMMGPSSIPIIAGEDKKGNKTSKKKSTTTKPLQNSNKKGSGAETSLSMGKANYIN